MLMAVLAVVFVPFAAVLLGQRGPGSAYVLRVRVGRKRAGVLDGDLDQAVRLNIGVLAAGDNGILESPSQAVSGENSVGMRHLGQLTGYSVLENASSVPLGHGFTTLGQYDREEAW